MHLTYQPPRRRRSAHPVLGAMVLAAGAFLLGARTSDAHVLDAAVATPDCGTNTIQLHLTGSLMLNGPFSVPYTITFNCTDGGRRFRRSRNRERDRRRRDAGVAGRNLRHHGHAGRRARGPDAPVSGTATLFQAGAEYNTAG